jgi:protein-tyrosine-phosphatase
MKVIFVCTGNTCRSPMAEGFANFYNNRYHSEMELCSRGVMVREGSRVHANAVIAMENFSNDISDHRAKVLKQFDITEDTLVLAMTENHVSFIKENYLIEDHQLFSLKAYAGEVGDISDPFGMSQNIYNACAAEIKDAVKASIKKMLNINK